MVVTSGSTASISAATSTASPPRWRHPLRPAPQRRLALLFYADGEKRYILAPAGVQVGQTVVSGPDVSIENGNAMPLSAVPLGSSVHCVELYAGRGGQMVRTAGAQVMAKGDYVALKLPSTEVRLVRRGRRHPGRGGQLRSPQHQPARLVVALAGASSPGPRQCDEPPATTPTVVVRAGLDRPFRPGDPLGQPALGLKTRKRNKPSN